VIVVYCLGFRVIMVQCLGFRVIMVHCLGLRVHHKHAARLLVERRLGVGLDQQAPHHHQDVAAPEGTRVRDTPSTMHTVETAGGSFHEHGRVSRHRTTIRMWLHPEGTRATGLPRLIRTPPPLRITTGSLA